MISRCLWEIYHGPTAPVRWRYCLRTGAKGAVCISRNMSGQGLKSACDSQIITMASSTPCAFFAHNVLPLDLPRGWQSSDISRLLLTCNSCSVRFASFTPWACINDIIVSAIYGDTKGSAFIYHCGRPPYRHHGMSERCP